MPRSRIAVRLGPLGPLNTYNQNHPPFAPSPTQNLPFPVSGNAHHNLEQGYCPPVPCSRWKRNTW